VHDVLSWMEASALGQLMRQAGPGAYAIANVAHVFGVATLFGSILVLDLRLLGAWRRVPLAPMAAAITPVAATGFTLAATSGVLLLVTTATDYDGNPYLLIKFPAIALGLLNVVVLGRSRSWRASLDAGRDAPGDGGGARQRVATAAEQRQLARMGGLSLACWVTAIAAGRLIAYW
jgi:hypothetical protein